MAMEKTRTTLFADKQVGGMIRIVDQTITDGQISFVDSGSGTDSVGRGRNPDDPVATVDYAISNLCTGSKADVIYVMPGHTETFSTTDATDFVCDVADVEIIGLGVGSDRPEFTLSTAGNYISVTAANVTLRNLQITSNYTGGTTYGLSLGASADGAKIDGLYFKEASSSKEMLIGINVAANCDDIIIENCLFYGSTGSSQVQCINLAGGSDRSIIRNNILYTDCSSAAIACSIAASTEIQILDNIIWNSDAGAGIGVNSHASGTGMVANNLYFGGKDTVVGFEGDAMTFMENYTTNAQNASGILKPSAYSS